MANKRQTGPKKLPPLRKRFCEEYVIDLNAHRAAERAGYSKKTAHVQGHELLKIPLVAAYVDKLMAKRSKRTEITADNVLHQLGNIAFADIRKLFTWDMMNATFVPSINLTKEEAAAISGIKSRTTTFTYKDGTQETKLDLELKTEKKVPALVEIGKHLGIAERVEMVIHDEMVDTTDGSLVDETERLLKKLKKQVGK